MGRPKNEVKTEIVPKEVIDDTPNFPAVVETSAIQEITKAEIDTQIATAKKYPRSIKKFRQEALTMATFDVAIAGQCFYTLKRAGKLIDGPSVRLAEICANAWGNMRYGARIVGEDDKCVIAQGISHDLEKNVSDTIEISRRITNKEGIRFGDDMVQVTKNAACSIALRNAIFKTIPFAYVKPIYDQAKKAAAGSLKTLKSRKAEMVKAFEGLKISTQMIEKFLDKPLEDAGLADIETLIGTYTAIKEGDTTVAEQFNIKSKSDAVMPQRKSETQGEEIPFGN